MAVPEGPALSIDAVGIVGNPVRDPDQLREQLSETIETALQAIETEMQEFVAVHPRSPRHRRGPRACDRSFTSDPARSPNGR